MIIQIPFSGFYCSIHDDNIDYELDHSVFTDHATGCTNNDRLSELAYDSMDWGKLHEDYAKEYVKNFNHDYGLDLVFESLQSPREYNFTTDRIHCHITEEEVIKLQEVTPLTMLKWSQKMFTSYEGFSSFYDNDYKTWGEVWEWDHNQLHCLLMAWLEEHHDITNWNEKEVFLMDDSMCNGFFWEMIYEHCTNKRLFTISDYLNKRKERVCA
jgi:hypothetical protein